MRTSIAATGTIFMALESLFQGIGDTGVDTFIFTFKQINVPHELVVS